MLKLPSLDETLSILRFFSQGLIAWYAITSNIHNGHPFLAVLFGSLFLAFSVVSFREYWVEFWTDWNGDLSLDLSFVDCFAPVFLASVAGFYLADSKFELFLSLFLVLANLAIVLWMLSPYYDFAGQSPEESDPDESPYSNQAEYDFDHPKPELDETDEPSGDPAVPISPVDSEYAAAFFARLKDNLVEYHRQPPVTNRFKRPDFIYPPERDLLLDLESDDDDAGARSDFPESHRDKLPKTYHLFGISIVLDLQDRKEIRRLKIRLPQSVDTRFLSALLSSGIYGNTVSDHVRIQARQKLIQMVIGPAHVTDTDADSLS